ncbi:hypothetical protein AA0616_2486 [Komagataeibacter nataicola NRIC 0616]|nr:hypothetical protein AA0616_2486 [Komagataeibacter nataicola NRIC 0616]
MPHYKNLAFFDQVYDVSFDDSYESGSIAQKSGIYRCCPNHWAI